MCKEKMMRETYWKPHRYNDDGTDKIIEPIIKVMFIKNQFTKILLGYNHYKMGVCDNLRRTYASYPARQYGLILWALWKINGSRYGYDYMPLLK